MKIAVPTRGKVVDDHFGHCEYYTVFTVENNIIEKSEIIESPQDCGCKSEIAGTLADIGVKTMLAGGIGMGAINKLNSYGIEVVRGCSGNVNELMDLWLKGNVSDSGESCGQHEHHHEHGHQCNHN